MHESALMRTNMAMDKGMVVVKGAKVLVVDDRVHTS
jgi:hypoxanthine phosphoribosyltransferase